MITRFAKKHYWAYNFKGNFKNGETLWLQRNSGIYSQSLFGTLGGNRTQHGRRLNLIYIFLLPELPNLWNFIRIRTKWMEKSIRLCDAACTFRQLGRYSGFSLYNRVDHFCGSISCICPFVSYGDQHLLMENYYFRYGTEYTRQYINSTIGHGVFANVWWFSFWINLFYYGAVAGLIAEQFVMENQVYRFKDRGNREEDIRTCEIHSSNLFTERN